MPLLGYDYTYKLIFLQPAFMTTRVLTSTGTACSTGSLHTEYSREGSCGGTEQGSRVGVFCVPCWPLGEALERQNPGFFPGPLHRQKQNSQPCGIHKLSDCFLVVLFCLLKHKLLEPGHGDIHV